MHMQTTAPKVPTAESILLRPTDANFTIKASFLNVNTESLFPQEVQAALENILLHLFLL